MACDDVGGALEVTSWTPLSLLSALLELLVAFVLLLGATIAYLTSIIVKCFGLRPPCFNQGGSLIEGRLLPTNFFSDRNSEKFQTLAHLLLPGGHWKSNVSGTCFPHSSSTDNNSSTNLNSSSTCFNSSNSGNPPPGKGVSQFRSRRVYLKSQQLDKTNVGNEDITLTNWTRCIFCSSPFQGTSGQRATKRKFANIIVEERAGCSSELSDEDLGHNAADGFIEMERSSSKIFPEDILAFDSENHKGSLEKAFDAMASNKNVDRCEDVTFEKKDELPLEGATQASSSQEITLQSNDALEELSQHLKLVSEDTALKLDSAIGILFPDNFIPEEGEHHYDSPRGELSQSPPVVSLVEKDEYLLQLENKETEMRVGDVKSEAGNAPLDIENDIDVLRKTLNAEREVLNAVYLELEQERNASAIATNETLAMITRLQKEKAALHMEARQFQRIAEEKAMYDQEAIAVLKDILMKREAEKLALEKEVELYRRRLLKERFEEWERTKKEVDGDREVAALEANKESMLLLEERDESKSSKIGGDQRESFWNTTCISSAQEDALFERNFTRGSVSTSLQSSDARNLYEAFLAVDTEHLEKQHQDIMKTSSSMPTSQSSLVEIGEDSAHDGSGDKYIVDPRTITTGQWKVFDEWDRCFEDYQVQFFPDTSVTVKLDGDATEEKRIKKPRFNGEEKWQTVLERIGNLESQIQYLRAKQNPERDDMPVADQRGVFCKDLGVERAQFVTPARKMLGCRCDQEKGSFEPKQWLSSDKKGVTEDWDLSIKSLGEKLSTSIECNDSLETSEVQSEKQCTQSSTDNTEFCLSGHSYISKFDQNTNKKNIMMRSHPTYEYLKTDDTFNGGSSNLDLGVETPEERCMLVTMDADKVSCSMLSETPLAGEFRTSGGSANRDSPESSNEQLPIVSRVLDFRTTSMVIRDNSRMAVDEEVQNLTSRLQVLEADRELMRHTIESMKDERGEVELLQEIAHQLRELHSFKSEDSQQQLIPSSGSSLKPDKSFLKKRRCGSGTYWFTSPLPEANQIQDDYICY